MTRSRRTVLYTEGVRYRCEIYIRQHKGEVPDRVYESDTPFLNFQRGDLVADPADEQFLKIFNTVHTLTPEQHKITLYTSRVFDTEAFRRDIVRKKV